MRKLIAALFLTAIVAAIAGLAVTTERAEALSIDLDCTPGPVVDGVGTVKCTLNVTDLPPPLQDFTLQIEATYNDRDNSGHPSHGDRLKCIHVSGSLPGGGTIDRTFCRPGVPPPISPP